MSNLLETIKRRFLRGRVDVGNIEEIEQYEKEIASLDMDGIIAAIKDLALKPVALIDSIGEDLAPIKIEALVEFSCDRCGRCCSSFRIGISWADITSYLQQGAPFIFPFIIVPEDRAYYQLMTKREFLEAKASFSVKRQKEIETINPSLEQVLDHDLENCIFFNPSTRDCTIHEKKPLECKTYPAGNLVFNDKENACDLSCFGQGNGLDLLELARMLDQKRVPDYVLSMLFGIAQAGGWRTDFFKIALLFEKIRSLA